MNDQPKTIQALNALSHAINQLPVLKKPNGEFDYGVDESVKKIVAALAVTATELAASVAAHNRTQP